MKISDEKANIKAYGTQIKVIDASELRRTKAAEQCQHCVGPQDQKGSYETIDCFQWIRLEKGPARFSKKRRRYYKD